MRLKGVQVSPLGRTPLDLASSRGMWSLHACQPVCYSQLSWRCSFDFQHTSTDSPDLFQAKKSWFRKTWLEQLISDAGWLRAVGSSRTEKPLSAAASTVLPLPQHWMLPLSRERVEPCLRDGGRVWWSKNWEAVGANAAAGNPIGRKAGPRARIEAVTGREWRERHVDGRVCWWGLGSWWDMRECESPWEELMCWWEGVDTPGDSPWHWVSVGVWSCLMLGEWELGWDGIWDRSGQLEGAGLRRTGWRVCTC